MEKKQIIEKLMAGVAFAFFVLIACYKLANTPLWFDETIEFWHSKIMFGKLPYEVAGLSTTANMYQRIVSTYQPPLYNVIMHFWLKFGTTEWWFRFFGVVMGFVGNIGIYKTIRKVSNGFNAAGAVFFSSCVFQLVYYWQECAEYCLMLGTLCWTLYGFICLLEKQSLKNIILFTILSILPVYSQYGAAFPVVTMLIIAYVYILLKKDKKSIINITVSYLVALIVAAIPLIYFFLLKQMKNQHGGDIQTTAFTVDGNIFTDMFNSFKTVIAWNLFSYYNEFVATIFAWIVIICVVLLFIISKKTYVKMLAITNIVTWLMYYFAVKLGVYSYGSFGSRYDLFFIPLWLISLFGLGYEIYVLLRSNSYKKFKVLSYAYIGFYLVMIACFMLSSWIMRLQYHWDKAEDMRTAVNTWLEVGAQDSQTIVYYGGGGGFAYYLQEEDNYSPDIEKNVTYMPYIPAMIDKTAEEYTEYINSLYGNEWPTEIYIIGTHTLKDINALASSFTNKGYIREDLCTSNCSLMRLSYIESEYKK